MISATVVHELDHWMSRTFIGIAKDLVCVGGAEHLQHVGCEGKGDHRLYGNLMAPGDAGHKGRFISLEQARIFNEYADQVQR